MGKHKKPSHKKKPSKKKGGKVKDDEHDSGSEEFNEMPKGYQPSHDVIDPDEQQIDDSLPADQIDKPTPVPRNANKLAVSLYDVRDAFSDKAQDDITNDGDRGAGLDACRRGFGKAKNYEQLEVYTNHFKINFRTPESGAESATKSTISVSSVCANF
jgi:hypothetical protein